ncbi:unnamed protein product [Urochloa decumbens]|uniref:Late embryogenesis abundant protein LEA-2 subgroup domain-containing protein n=1 Tax=Urochloa decumbens TaxID=240449 RepID=A0ABC9DGG5_9POAL
MEPDEPSFCYRLVTAVLYPILLCVAILFIAASILGVVMVREDSDRSPGYSMESSVRLVGVKGLESALAPGAASPAFDLLVRVDNGVNEEYCGSGDVTVSYAGVPLARGHTPSFSVESLASLTFAVNATTEAIGVPDHLFRLMSAERRWGAAELEVRMQLGRPCRRSFAWSVGLDG